MARRPGAGGARRRVTWTIGDQALASATNIGTAVVAARSLDPRDFGAFGLAFTVYLLCLGACRALVTEPLLSRYSSMTASQLATRARHVVGAAAGVGLAFTVTLLVASPLLGGPAGRALSALALLLPALVVQDAWRYYFVATERPSAALYNDGIWCITQLVLLVGMASANAFNLFTVIMWWGLSGTVAALAGCIATRTVPALSSTWRWIAINRDLGARYGAEFLAASGAGHGTLLALGAIVDLVALGAVRATQVYFGPINVVFGGIYLALVPEGARLSGDRRRLRRLMGVASVALVVMAGTWLGIGLLLPAQVGTAMFGASWDDASTLLVPIGLGVLGGGVAAGGMAGLRALSAARGSLRARLVGLPLMIGAPLAGASAGARGFAFGLAGAIWAGAAVWWWQFERALRDPHRPEDVVLVE
jgi:hypothetical protein